MTFGEKKKSQLCHNWALLWHSKSWTTSHENSYRTLVYFSSKTPSILLQAYSTKHQNCLLISDQWFHYSGSEPAGEATQPKNIFPKQSVYPNRSWDTCIWSLRWHLFAFISRHPSLWHTSLGWLWESPNKFTFQEVIRWKRRDTTANKEIDDICSRAGGDFPQVTLQGLPVVKAVLVSLGTLVCNVCPPLALKQITLKVSTNTDLQARRPELALPK